MSDGSDWVKKNIDMRSPDALAIINGANCDASIRAASLNRGYYEVRKLPPKRYTREQLSPFDECTCEPRYREYCNYGWMATADLPDLFEVIE